VLVSYRAVPHSRSRFGNHAACTTRIFRNLVYNLRGEKNEDAASPPTCFHEAAGCNGTSIRAARKGLWGSSTLCHESGSFCTLPMVDTFAVRHGLCSRGVSESTISAAVLGYPFCLLHNRHHRGNDKYALRSVSIQRHFVEHLSFMMSCVANSVGMPHGV
jgi:hypothetical protein